MNPFKSCTLADWSGALVLLAKAAAAAAFLVLVPLLILAL